MQDIKKRMAIILITISALSSLFSHKAYSHGDMAPQSVDTKGLNNLGEEWLNKNPYKNNDLAIEIGSTGYTSNCARCHGLDVKSGGIAPDLRYLEDDDEGDSWFINRVRKGYHQNGITKMPKFEGILSQEAMWAIRTYINSRPE